MIGDVKMQTIKRRTGRSLTGDRPLFLALISCIIVIQLIIIQDITEAFYVKQQEISVLLESD